MTTTPNIGLTLPAVGADQDVWGDILNADLVLIDTAVGARTTKTYVDAEIDAVEAVVATKADKTYVDAQDAALTAQINAKAPVNSPTFTGNPAAPTPADSDRDTSIANTTFVQRAIGISEPPYVNQASYTLVASDLGKTIRIGALTTEIRVPLSTAINWPWGGRVDIINQGGSTVNFVGETGVTISHKAEALAQMNGAWKGATLYCWDNAGNNWALIGDLVSA